MRLNILVLISLDFVELKKLFNLDKGWVKMELSSIVFFLYSSFKDLLIFRMGFEKGFVDLILREGKWVVGGEVVCWGEEERWMRWWRRELRGKEGEGEGGGKWSVVELNLREWLEDWGGGGCLDWIGYGGLRGESVVFIEEGCYLIIVKWWNK